MRRVLDMMWNAVIATLDALEQWLRTFQLDPAQWSVMTWLLLAAFALLLALLVLRLRRGRAPESKPDLLVSLGEIRQQGPGGRFELSMNISNMSDYPVHLLELAVCSDMMPEPIPVEISMLLGPQQVVEYHTELPRFSALDGTVELYAYTPHARRRSYCLRAPFVWEPWNDRYKIAPLEQRVGAARTLASARVQRRRRQAWRRQQQALAAASRQAKATPAMATAEADEPRMLMGLMRSVDFLRRLTRSVTGGRVAAANESDHDAVAAAPLQATAHDGAAEPSAANEADTQAAARDDEPAEERKRPPLEFPEDF